MNGQTHSKVFISYSWEDEDHKSWVRSLAERLRKDGVDVKLDQWELKPGDQIPKFMEQMISENDYVLIICTPTYKLKSDTRHGGVGYEGDIMTGIKLSTDNRRKFIPLIRKGSIESAIPVWLTGIYAVNFTQNDDQYDDLHATFTNRQLEKKPSLGEFQQRSRPTNTTVQISQHNTDEIKLIGIIADEVTMPLNDGSRGSALYSIPFLLNKTPDRLWSELFVQFWDRPTRFSSMHRSGIASVTGNKIVLNGTTIEEVRDVHQKTLRLAISTVNQRYTDLMESRRKMEETEQTRNAEHRKNIEDTSKDINFDHQ